MTEKQAGAELAKFHRERSERTRNTIKATLRAIEAEIAERGYYCDPADPDKHQRLSMSEVLRRAGVSETYLRNPRHRDLRDIVQDWLEVQRQQSATSKPEGRRVKRDTIQFYENALREVAAEAVHWRAEKAALEKRIADQEAEIATTRDSDNVVGIKSRRAE